MLDTCKCCVRDHLISTEFIMSPGQIAAEPALDPELRPEAFA